MNHDENTQRLLGRILSQPIDNEELAAVDAFGGTQILTGETIGFNEHHQPPPTT
ncbi:MAG TPA: hypothetical protein VK660_03220 [Xanthomonadaceae bacterium]|jgi:hypothetical protein|nr:hypothetical protein [Xanthomonadaceae bacterium]